MTDILIELDEAVRVTEEELELLEIIEELEVA
jgi:hypothetical protein